MSKQFPQPPNEVFDAAKRGDGKAIERIVEAYRFLVRREAAGCAPRGTDLLELEQEGVVVMLDKCLRNFDPNEGRFSTLLVKALRQHLPAYLARDRVIRGPTPYNYRHLSPKAAEAARRARTIFPLGGGDLTYRPQRLDNRPTATDLIALLRDHRDRQVMRRRYVSGWDVARIAAEQSMSRQQVQRVIRTSMTRLRRLAPQRKASSRNMPPRVRLSAARIRRFARLVGAGGSIRKVSRLVGVSPQTGSKLCRLLGITRRCHCCGLPLKRNQSRWCSECGPEMNR